MVYAITEVGDARVKDAFYGQLDTAVGTVSLHDDLVVHGDMNAVTGTSRSGFISVIGPYGSGTANDNTIHLIT